MLKVVGASWTQTRVSSYVLGVFAIVGLFIIIFGGNIGSDRLENDGNYAATAYWQKKIGYGITFWGQGNDLEEIPKGAARAYYRKDLTETGWSKVEIETNADYPDSVQAYSAGLVEGSLTWQLIYWHWQNTVENVCNSVEEKCDRIREYLKMNSEYIRTKAMKLEEKDPFWHQVRMFYAQLDGMETGFRYAVKRSRQSIEIPPEDFLWMNVGSDILDLAKMFDINVGEATLDTPSLTTALIKIFNKSEPIVHVAHSTGGMYHSMLRIVKRYTFNYHLFQKEGSPPVFGSVLTFSSYPGIISSQDDFYTVTSVANAAQPNKLIVVATPITNNNPQLWNKVNAEDQVLMSVRVLVANRLALDGKSWSRYFSRSNSGTGNKQWLILNTMKLKREPWKKPNRAEGLLWVVEQIPGLIHASDQSHMLHKKGYWASFGLPFNEDVQVAIRLPEEDMAREVYIPRAELFNQCQNNCSSTLEILEVMRHGIDPSMDKIGARGDLYPQNPLAYGVIDSKIVTGSYDKLWDFQVISGPVFMESDTEIVVKIEENQERNEQKTGQVEEEEEEEEINVMKVVPPFQWSASDFKHEQHIGQPDIWRFQLSKPEWVWI